MILARQSRSSLWDKNNKEMPVLPPPLVILPELPQVEGLEAGTEGLSPDRLLQQPDCQLGTTCVPLSARLPQPPVAPAPSPLPLRGAVLSFCRGDPKEKQRARQRCTGCVWWVFSSSCCLFLASLAVLTAYWSLFPMCTTCTGDVKSTAAASAIELDAMEIDIGGSVQPFSTLRINQLQVLGTHNSYHRRTSIPIVGDLFSDDYPPVVEQLDAGVRHLELDVHYDWKTGRWFVYHISVVDALSSCHCLRSCLDEVRAWSDLNPTHHIIFMDIELKLTGDFLRICGKHTPDQDRSAFLRLQDTILEAFPLDRILTPRMVQGDFGTLNEAVSAGGSCNSGSCGSNVSSSVSGEATVGAVPGMAGGWPLVDDSRGMILFVMDYQTVNLKCREGIRKALPLSETVFFERTPMREWNKNSPYAAFTQLCECDPEWKAGIRKRVRSGLIVRQPSPSMWVVPGPDGLVSSTITGNETYLAKTPAQLLVVDDSIRGVEKGVCRSRCSTLVPEEECVLEGFC